MVKNQPEIRQPEACLFYTWQESNPCEPLAGADQAVPGRVQDHDARAEGGLQALQQRRQGSHRPPHHAGGGTA